MDARREQLECSGRGAENGVAQAGRVGVIALSRAFGKPPMGAHVPPRVLCRCCCWRFGNMPPTAGFFDPSFVPSPTTVLDSWWQWIFGPRSELAWYSGTWFEYVYLS